MGKFSKVAVSAFVAFCWLNSGISLPILLGQDTIAQAKSSSRSSGGSRSSGSRNTSPSNSNSGTGSSGSRNTSPSNSNNPSSGSSSGTTTQPKANPANPSASPANPANSGTTGARSRGGSFQENDPNRPSSPQTSPSPAAPTNVPDNQPPVIYNNQPVIIHNNQPPGIYNSGPVTPTSTSSGDYVSAVIFLLVVGIIFFAGTIALLLWVVSALVKGRNAKSTKIKATVTCVQVAMMAEARAIQAQLAELATSLDISTKAGLTQQLQESVMALLRSKTSWTHGRSLSQTVNDLKSAETLFEQMSINERQKFTTEALVNLQGQVRSAAGMFKSDIPIQTDEYADYNEYIVVTLLVATKDQKPLFEQIHNETELKDALSKLGTISGDNLMVFELLWSPTSGSLSYDQLLLNYPDMCQLI